MSTDPIMSSSCEISRLAEQLRAERLTVAIQADAISQIRESNDESTQLIRELTQALKDKGDECERLRTIANAALHSLVKTVHKMIPGYPESQMAIAENLTVEQARTALAAAAKGEVKP